MSELNRIKSVPVNVPPACPHCARALPPGAPAGLCPTCLLAQGTGTEPGSRTSRIRFEPPPLAEVARLFPQLEILRLLGAGGMGAVYQARQPALDRFVALKILPGSTEPDTRFSERFHREARALARLSHPNIVAVHEFGQAGTWHYFLMEYVDGTNLRQLELADRLSSREAMQLIPQLCDALQYAHDEGVVHRDIKPENVLVDRKGRVKIADFGLAKILDQDPEAGRLTLEGQVMGTPHYMAPEQVERPLTVDHRADIYSLGVVFYELLTGDLPLGKFLPPSRKVQVDVRWDEIVLRALENDPSRRYQHASEMKTGLETVTSVPGPTATPKPAPVSSIGPPIGSSTEPQKSIRSRWDSITPAMVCFAVCLFVVVMTTAVSVSLPRTFIATTTVALTGPDGSNPGSLGQSVVSAAIATSLSPEALEHVANQLKLSERWGLTNQQGTLPVSAAVDRLHRMLTVRPTTHGSLLLFVCHNASAIEAAEIANAVAEAFLLNSRRRDARLESRQPNSNRWLATVIDRAAPPQRPAYPNLHSNLVLSVFGGGLLGGVSAFVVWGLRRRAGMPPPSQNLRRCQPTVSTLATLGIGLGIGASMLIVRSIENERLEYLRYFLLQSDSFQRMESPDVALVPKAPKQIGDGRTPPPAALHVGPLERRSFSDLLNLDTGAPAIYKLVQPSDAH